MSRIGFFIFSLHTSYSSILLKSKYKFRFLVDDAHGFGTLGENGKGAGNEQGIQDQIDVYFATFAKSMASTGAFVAADKEIIDYLKYNMRSQMFAKSLQMQLVKGALKRLDLLRTRPEFKAKLWENVNALQNGLKENGFDIKDEIWFGQIYFLSRVIFFYFLLYAIQDLGWWDISL